MVLIDFEAMKNRLSTTGEQAQSMRVVMMQYYLLKLLSETQMIQSLLSHRKDFKSKIRIAKDCCENSHQTKGKIWQSF